VGVILVSTEFIRASQTESDFERHWTKAQVVTRALSRKRFSFFRLTKITLGVHTPRGMDLCKTHYAFSLFLP
jgi:uncharacterized membrane protein (DUF4010 family)